jgi:hypothetical protein
MKEKIDKDMIHLRVKLNDLMDQKSPYKEYIHKTIPMLENLSTFYRNSMGEIKRKILGCIFSEKIVLEKGRVATFSFTTPIRVLTNDVKVFESRETKKEVEKDLLSSIAPLIAQSCNQFTSFALS